MSNKDLTTSVQDLQHSVSGIEKKTGDVDLDELGAKIPGRQVDNLESRVKDLEKTDDTQGILLDQQGVQIEGLQKLLDAQLQTDEDLREQIDKLRAELAKKRPQDAAKAKEGKGP